MTDLVNKMDMRVLLDYFQSIGYDPEGPEIARMEREITDYRLELVLNEVYRSFADEFSHHWGVSLLRQNFWVTYHTAHNPAQIWQLAYCDRDRYFSYIKELTEEELRKWGQLALDISGHRRNEEETAKRKANQEEISKKIIAVIGELVHVKIVTPPDAMPLAVGTKEGQTRTSIFIQANDDDINTTSFSECTIVDMGVRTGGLASTSIEIVPQDARTPALEITSELTNRDLVLTNTKDMSITRRIVGPGKMTLTRADVKKGNTWDFSIVEHPEE